MFGSLSSSLSLLLLLDTCLKVFLGFICFHLSLFFLGLLSSLVLLSLDSAFTLSLQVSIFRLEFVLSLFGIEFGLYRAFLGVSGSLFSNFGSGLCLLPGQITFILGFLSSSSCHSLLGHCLEGSVCLGIRLRRFSIILGLLSAGLGLACLVECCLLLLVRLLNNIADLVVGFLSRLLELLLGLFAPFSGFIIGISDDGCCFLLIFKILVLLLLSGSHALGRVLDFVSSLQLSRFLHLGRYGWISEGGRTFELRLC